MPAPLDVLVADDEPKICRLLEQLLQAKGCTVRLAQDGLEALSQFRRKSADVVITDLKMPKLTGVELLAELKRLDPLVTVVVITAYPSIEGAVEAMKIGASDFLTKPFDVVQVQAILYRCEQRVSLSRQLRSTGEGLVKLEELNRRLAEVNDLKDQFLSALSHEVNTPMCLMSQWIYLLADGLLGTLGSRQKDALGVVIKAYERLNRLLEQVMDLMHGHEILLRHQSVDAQALVQQAVADVTPKAQSRSVTITTHLPGSSISLTVDRNRCLAAFQYLLDNAVQFNADGGRVEIEMTETPQAVRVQIRDTGIGIPPEEQERVFAPFYQVDRRLNRSFDGVGIGLTLAKRYVELHNGAIQLSSDAGKGTTVVVTLPRPHAPTALPSSEPT